MNAANPVTLPLSGYKARHIRFEVNGKVATVTLDRPERKNPLTFDSYAELGALFRAAAKDKEVKAFVITGAGGNFCSGGDVFEIIEPLTKMNTVELLDFTRMTGEVVKAMRAAPQPIIAAVDGVCDPRHGLRRPHRNRRRQGRVPVQPRGACRLRHGRLRDPAAHRGAGAGVRASVYRSRHGR
jgi:hypothetical protein